MAPKPPGKALGAVLRAPNRLYDWNVGWLLGGRFCRLTHVGRKSGEEHRTVLEVVGTKRALGEVIVMSGFGPAADWYRNIRANGEVTVETGRRRFAADFRVLDADEAASAMEDYERRNRLIAPIVRRVLSRLVGWPYDGTEEARRKLVAELPMVAFWPKVGDR